LTINITGKLQKNIMRKILVIGAHGQLGTVLTKALQVKHGFANILATDIKASPDFEGDFQILDATNFDELHTIIKVNNIGEIYHLAAILSANGEKAPLNTWDINMKAWLNVLEAARLENVSKVFYPSSIAVFGDSIPKKACPQNVFLDPSTVYGISKAAGENWANYYFKKYNLDVRSLRYPGIIGYQSLPGGGTTDYAIDIFHKAVMGEDYTCFLSENARLPMIYMDDAIKATLDLMDAPVENIKTRTAYNIASVSFTPSELFKEIQKKIPTFKIKYAPDFRQKIAETWPEVIVDTEAKADWNWKADFSLSRICDTMLEELNKKITIAK
jgi:threonine 3-dehydrogenase